MGFESIALFGVLDLELESTGTGTVTLSTDMPGHAMAVRETRPIPPSGRTVLRFRLQSTTMGHLYSLKVAPIAPGVIRLYGGRIWARLLPGALWAWYAVPIPPTAEEWQEVKLPIPPVSDWEPRKLPVPETTDWAPAKLPIPETGDWAPAKLPIPETGDWAPAKLPVPDTTDWAAQQLPIKPTPANPEWVDIQVDQ